VFRAERLEEGFDRAGVGDVECGRARQSAMAGRIGLLLDLPGLLPGRADVGHHHMMPLARQAFGRGKADAAARPGDDGDLLL